MDQNSKKALGLATGRGASPQGRTQSPLVPGVHALGVPPSAVGPSRKSFVHLPTIASGRAVGLWTTRVDGNHGLANTQFLPADLVVGLGVVGRVRQQAIDGQTPNSLPHGGQEIRGVVARTVAQLHGGYQVTEMVIHKGQLGKATVSFHAALAGQKVPTDVVALQTSGVYRRLWLLLNQAARSSNAENRIKQWVKSPFFSSRCEA